MKKKVVLASFVFFTFIFIVFLFLWKTNKILVLNGRPVFINKVFKLTPKDNWFACINDLKVVVTELEKNAFVLNTFDFPAQYGLTNKYDPVIKDKTCIRGDTDCSDMDVQICFRQNKMSIGPSFSYKMDIFGGL